MEIERTKTKVRTEKFLESWNCWKIAEVLELTICGGVRRFSDVGANFGC